MKNNYKFLAFFGLGQILLIILFSLVFMVFHDISALALYIISLLVVEIAIVLIALILYIVKKDEITNYFYEESEELSNTKTFPILPNHTLDIPIINKNTETDNIKTPPANNEGKKFSLDLSYLDEE